MAASLASAMTSAMTSAKTSSVTSVAAAAELTPNYYGSSTPYFALSWAGPYVGATLGYEWGSIDNNPTRSAGSKPASTGRTETLPMAAKPT
jgi:outer membrane immunogenic protein